MVLEVHYPGEVRSSSLICVVLEFSTWISKNGSEVKLGWVDLKEQDWEYVT